MTLTYQDLELPYFVNSRRVGVIGRTPLTVVDATSAAQLAKLNVFLAGRKGCGKSQLLRDVRDSRFGSRGLIVEGRPDLKTDQLFKIMNLKILREGATTDEIVELAQSVQYRFFGADEINRSPEVVQNEFLSIMNGEILHKGNPIPLGNGFSVGIATGNLGNGEYVGTFKIDAALADRLHVFMDLDYWKPTDDDMAVLDARKMDSPQVKRTANVRDISDKIIAAHNEIVAAPTPHDTILIGRYLERALDYCKTFPTAGNSKDNLRERWPTICTEKKCDLKDTLCARVKSVGERTVEAARKFAKGLQYVAKLKDPTMTEDSVAAILIATKLMLPYANVLSPQFLREEGNFNNPSIAAKNAVEGMGKMRGLEQTIRDQFYDKGDPKNPGPLTTALAYAQRGQLAECSYTPSGEWGFVKPYLQQLNEVNKQQ